MTNPPPSDSKVRVLFIHTATRPPLGADTWIQALIIRHLDRKTHEVHVACATGTTSEPTPTFKAMQEFLRERRPPTLVATGANDEIFPAEVVRQILTDHPDAEYHPLQTGHFALEDKAAEIAALMRDFLARTVPRASRLKRPVPSPSRPARTNS